jgi:hypothetical protein
LRRLVLKYLMLPLKLVPKGYIGRHFEMVASTDRAFCLRHQNTGIDDDERGKSWINKAYRYRTS